MTNTDKILEGDTVTFTDHKTKNVVTVEHLEHNRCQISYGDTYRVVPFMAAYQVILEKSLDCIKNRHFTYQYTPTMQDKKFMFV